MLALVAEPAADIGGDNPDLAVGHAELGRDRPAHQMDRLGGVVERDRLADGVVDGDRRARLDRGAGDAVVVDVDFDRPDGRCHGAGDRLLVAAGPEIADISGRLVVQRDGAADGIARADRRRQRMVSDLHQLRRVVRRGRRFGEDRGHRLADMPHAVARQRPARRLRHRRSVLGRNLPEAGHRADPVTRHVGAGQHRGDAGNGARRGRLDRQNLRVGMIGAHEAAMQRAGDDAVRHIASPAGEKPLVFQTPDRRADTGIRFHRCLRA